MVKIMLLCKKAGVFTLAFAFFAERLYLRPSMRKLLQIIVLCLGLIYCKSPVQRAVELNSKAGANQSYFRRIQDSVAGAVADTKNPIARNELATAYQNRVNIYIRQHPKDTFSLYLDTLHPVGSSVFVVNLSDSNVKYDCKMTFPVNAVLGNDPVYNVLRNLQPKTMNKLRLYCLGAQVSESGELTIRAVPLPMD